MPVDLTTAMIGATVEFDQPLADGKRTVGTAFLINAPMPDGSARTVLVTAGHVLDDMPGPTARIGYRVQDAAGIWHFSLQPLAIRQPGGAPLWRRNPDHDVAVIAIQAPPEFARAAIPESWLADEAAIQAAGIGPGDQMYDLGYPQGLAANSDGFPIVRVGWVASYPLVPISRYQTFLLDFRVFNGNSGGPVFITSDTRRRSGAPDVKAEFVAGMLTQQTRVGDERLELGIVVQAEFVRQTIDLLDRPLGADPGPVPPPPPAAAAEPH